MKKIFLLTSFLVFVLCSVYGQSANQKDVWPGDYFNGFQKHEGENIDSAMYFVRLLAANPHYNAMLEDLLHDSFAQSFLKKWERFANDHLKLKPELEKRIALNKQILNQMITDSVKSLATSSMPIYYWQQAQQYENNPSKLAEIANLFIKTQLSASDVYHNRVGRYALLIHQILSNNTKLKKLSNQLFAITQNKLKSNSILKAKADTLSRQLLGKRSWYRYLNAYCNYTLANQALKKDKIKEAGNYLLAAYQYSPDRFDRTTYSNYFYDMHFLFEEEKNTFQGDYVDYLKKYSNNKEAILQSLQSMSLTDPAFKKDLKEYYTHNFSHRGPFPAYWQNSINKDLTAAPTFTIKKMNGETFSSKDQKGKWVLLDFWGTWCGPCRAEHPDLQKLYTDLFKNKQGFELLTIACHDDSTKVENYMKEKAFDFPVAMSDNKVEKIYPVNGYPSKFLITPEGKFLTIPFGIDWVNFIKNVTEL